MLEPTIVNIVRLPFRVGIILVRIFNREERSQQGLTWILLPNFMVEYKK